jgi:hypothetical protein
MGDEESGDEEQAWVDSMLLAFEKTLLEFAHHHNLTRSQAEDCMTLSYDGKLKIVITLTAPEGGLIPKAK